MVYWLTKKSYTISYTTPFNIGLPGVQTLGIQTLLHQCPSRGKVAPGLLPFRPLTAVYDLALPPSHTGKNEKSLPYQTLTINLANLTQLLTTHRLCHFRASSCQLQVRHFSSLFWSDDCDTSESQDHAPLKIAEIRIRCQRKSLLCGSSDVFWEQPRVVPAPLDDTFPQLHSITICGLGWIQDDSELGWNSSFFGSKDRCRSWNKRKRFK